MKFSACSRMHILCSAAQDATGKCNCSKLCGASLQWLLILCCAVYWHRHILLHSGYACHHTTTRSQRATGSHPQVRTSCADVLSKQVNSPVLLMNVRLGIDQLCQNVTWHSGACMHCRSAAAVVMSLWSCMFGVGLHVSERILKAIAVS